MTRTSTLTHQHLVFQDVDGGDTINLVKMAAHENGDILTLSGSGNQGQVTLKGLDNPTADSDAATKAYVDSVANGLHVKGSVRVATTANIDLTDLPSIDGITLADGDRLLVKDQTDASENGIYVAVAGEDTLTGTRAVDFNSSVDVTSGAFTFVEEGSSHSDQGFVMVTDETITIDETDISFSKFSGAGQIIAGAGITKTGNTLRVADIIPHELEISDKLTVSDDTNSTSPTTGALIVSGGAGIGKNLVVAGDIRGEHNSSAIKFPDPDDTTATYDGDTHGVGVDIIPDSSEVRVQSKLITSNEILAESSVKTTGDFCLLATGSKNVRWGNEVMLEHHANKLDPDTTSQGKHSLEVHLQNQGTLACTGRGSFEHDLTLGSQADLLLKKDGAAMKFGADSDVTLTHVADTGLRLNADLDLKKDAAVLSFGADSDVTLTHIPDAGLRLNTNKQLQFHDSSAYISHDGSNFLLLHDDDAVYISAGAGADSTNEAVEVRAEGDNDSPGTRFYGKLTLTGSTITNSDNAIGFGSNNLSTTGTITASSVTSTSDARLKRNVNDIADAVAKVHQLRGVDFTWKESGKADAGVIAQEVEAVAPHWVVENAEGIKSVDYGKLSALLIQAVKEQQTTIDKQSSDIAELKAAVAALQAERA